MIDPSIVNEIEKANNEYRNAFYDMARVWWQDVILKWHWWVELGLAVLPWALWFIVHDRKNSRHLLAAGFLTLFISSVLDMTGIYLGLWNYHTMLLPIVPAHIPWDWSVMPVSAMLFYQFKPRINPWIKAAVFSGIGSFIAEPVFEWIGIYHTIAWQYWYSFPIYIAVYMAGWLIFRRTDSGIRVAS